MRKFYTAPGMKGKKRGWRLLENRTETSERRARTYENDLSRGARAQDDPPCVVHLVLFETEHTCVRKERTFR